MEKFLVSTSEKKMQQFFRNFNTYRLIHVARSLETFWFPQIILIWKLVVDYNRLLQVQMKYFQNGGTSGNTGNRRHLYFFK
jgi:hypothetical protein